MKKAYCDKKKMSTIHSKTWSILSRNMIFQNGLEKDSHNFHSLPRNILQYCYENSIFDEVSFGENYSIS